MQSSFRVIKNTSVVEGGNLDINTEFVPVSCVEKKAEQETSARNTIDSYENLAKGMIENARKQIEDMKAKAFVEAQNAYREAFQNGYEEGKAKGYAEGYEEARCIGEEEIRVLTYEAEETLKSAKYEYIKYFELKQKDMKDVIITIAESILKREVQSEDSINSMIFDAISSETRANSFIVRCNETYLESLRSEIENWKSELPFKCDIFLIKDNTIGMGKAVIQKNDGKIVVDIEYSLERLKRIFEGKDLDA